VEADVAPAKGYARGLLLPGLGKSMQRIAHSVDLPEGEIKRFVSASPWDHGRVQEHLVKGIPRDLPPASAPSSWKM
jgi:hypothetical protein